MLPGTQLNVAVWLSALVDIAIGAAVLWLFHWRARRRHEAPMLGFLPLALAVVGSFGGYCLAALVLLGGKLIDGYGLVRLAYVNGAVVPAALGTLLLILASRGNPVRVPMRVRLLAMFLLAPLPICVYASFVEPYRLQIERTEVPLAGFEPGGEPVRIAVLADIQTDRITDYEHRVIERTLAERPDVIVLPGDFFQGTKAEFREQLPHFRELLGKLAAPGGVFACQGNMDRLNRIQALFEDSTVCWLHNRVAVTEVRGRRLAIGGVEWHYSSADAQQTVRALRDIDADARLLLCHAPDGALLTSPDDEVDLVIAGHTHGGQVVVPGFGPLLTASRVPRHIAAGGLHYLAHQLLYVSRGVGFERGGAAPVRLFCPPEVSVLTLTGEH